MVKNLHTTLVLVLLGGIPVSCDAQEEKRPNIIIMAEYIGYVSGNVDYHSHIDQEGNEDWWGGDKIKQ